MSPGPALERIRKWAMKQEMYTVIGRKIKRSVRDTQCITYVVYASRLIGGERRGKRKEV